MANSDLCYLWRRLLYRQVNLVVSQRVQDKCRGFFIRFGQWQARLTYGEAEMVQGEFKRDGVGNDKQVFKQGSEMPVNTRGFDDPAGDKALYHPLNLEAHQVGS